MIMESKNDENSTNVDNARRLSPNIQKEKTFACPECGKKFDRKHKVEQHSVKHTGEKKYECGECGKTYGWKTALTHHLKTHTGVKEYQCLKCGECFSQSPALKRHDLRMHSTGEKKFQCDKCGRRFIMKNDLKTHMVSHSDVRPHVCEKCGATFKSKDTLKKHHVYIHSNVRNFECQECGKKFKGAGCLRGHMYIHTGIKKHQCEICGMRFIKPWAMRRHAKVHNPSPHPVVVREPTQACTKCDAKFLTKQKLSVHMKAVHPPPKHKCPSCGKFKSEAIFERHVPNCGKWKPKIKKELPRCIKCCREFESQSSLDRHLQLCDLLMLRPGGGFISTPMQTINDDSNQASCSTTQPTATISLKLSYPEIAASFRCWQCGILFFGKRVLDAHVRICHWKQTKKANSDQTPDGIVDPVTLKLSYSNTDNINNVTRLPSKYSCSICKLHFKSSLNLEQHFQVCISKAHTCQQCDKSFLDKQVLDAHVLKHHKMVNTIYNTFHFKPNAVSGSNLERNLTDQVALTRDQEALESWSSALERTASELPNKMKVQERVNPKDDLTGVDVAMESTPSSQDQINKHMASASSIINVKQEIITSSVSWPPNSQDQDFIQAETSNINEKVTANLTTTTLTCVVCGEPGFSSSLVDRFKPHNVGLRYLCPECDVHLESVSNVNEYFRKAALVMHNW